MADQAPEGSGRVVVTKTVTGDLLVQSRAKLPDGTLCDAEVTVAPTDPRYTDLLKRATNP